MPNAPGSTNFRLARRRVLLRLRCCPLPVLQDEGVGRLPLQPAPGGGSPVRQSTNSSFGLGYPLRKRGRNAEQYHAFMEITKRQCDTLPGEQTLGQNTQRLPAVTQGSLRSFTSSLGRGVSMLRLEGIWVAKAPALLFSLF